MYPNLFIILVIVLRGFRSNFLANMASICCACSLRNFSERSGLTSFFLDVGACRDGTLSKTNRTVTLPNGNDYKRTKQSYGLSMINQCDSTYRGLSLWVQPLMRLTVGPSPGKPNVLSNLRPYRYS